MIYYTTVAGWMVYYFWAALTGQYSGLAPAEIADFFGAMLQSASTNVFYMALTVAAGFLILSFQLKNGLERVTKIIMGLLLVLMLVLSVHSLFIPGGEDGIRFYLMPDLEKMKAVGIGNVLIGAMTQAFFTLSIGIGSMAIMGSYIDRNHTLFGEAVRVAFLDTLVALCSGFIIFPACTAYGIPVNAGPSLLFITLPNVFNHLPAGDFWGALFFLFMIFAAFSTVLAVCEMIVACFRDYFGWSRRKACAILAPAILLLSLPCALGFNVLSWLHPMGGESTILDLEDFIFSNLLLPLGGIVFLTFCTTEKGWGWKNFLAEANAGDGTLFPAILYPWIKYGIPLCIIIITAVGLF